MVREVGESERGVGKRGWWRMWERSVKIGIWRWRERYQTSWGSEGPNANKNGFLFFLSLEYLADGQY